MIVMSDPVPPRSSYQYTGRENDGTGLFYYRARYYHPELQRFISEDSIEFEGGDVNLYAYVGNNPINFRDPLGQLSMSDLIHHPGVKALLEDLLSRLLEKMGQSSCPDRTNALANILAGLLAALSSGNAGTWTYGVILSTAAGFINPVVGVGATATLSYWAMWELLKSLELLDKGYGQMEDPCRPKKSKSSRKN
jgi:RHS repeat-associated protein